MCKNCLIKMIGKAQFYSRINAIVAHILCIHGPAYWIFIMAFEYQFHLICYQQSFHAAPLWHTHNLYWLESKRCHAIGSIENGNLRSYSNESDKVMDDFDFHKWSRCAQTRHENNLFHLSGASLFFYYEQNRIWANLGDFSHMVNSPRFRIKWTMKLGRKK